MRSSKYYLSCHLFLLTCYLFFYSSCDQKDVIYKKVYSVEAEKKLTETLLNAAGTDLYYQGSVGERMLILEAMKYDPSNAWGERELAVPYLKRGMAAEASAHYLRAAEGDPKEWLGYKMYCWLYFYRDYKYVLKEIDRFDSLTPNFVDYPQSTSVNYMRGICYLQLGDYANAKKYLEMHINLEEKEVGATYVSSLNYILLGMCYQKNGHFEKADSVYSLGLIHNSNTAELHFYKAQNLFLNNQITAARQSLKMAQDWFNKGSIYDRPYVEEFYAIYQEDLDALKVKLLD